MEGVLLLATLAQRFRFRLAPGAAVEPEALITLRPRGGLPMIAEETGGETGRRARRALRPSRRMLSAAAGGPLTTEVYVFSICFRAFVRA